MLQLLFWSHFILIYLNVLYEKNCQIFLNSLLLTKKKMVTTPVTKASDSPNQGLIKSIILIFIIYAFARKQLIKIQ